jgi:myo-inositol 2-dehydrogenase/D-chiro-inositol 1-dehydrogenase
MRFSLLGTDDETLAIARAVVAAGHVLRAAFEPRRTDLQTLRQLAPAIEVVDDWALLVGERAADAVIVARGNEDRRVEQLRVLFQAGVPTIVVHPVVSSMLDYYELDMNRQESGSLAIAYVPAVWHPAVERLHEAITAGSFGHLEQVVFERQLAERTRESVLAHFVRDVEVARLLCGDLTKVGAMASSGAEPDYRNLGIQMSGPREILVRWSVRPVDHEPGVTCSVVGSQASAKLLLPDAATATLEMRRGNQIERHEFADWDPADAAIDELVAGVQEGEAVHPTWVDACRDMELADAIERSLKRGRTIDLHFEEHTEHATFKSMMAAGGCALLIAALLMLIVATTAVNWNFPLAEYWPYVLAAALGIFLLLQTLKLAFPHEGMKGDGHEPQKDRP